jgi:hypothetical protein
VCVCVCVCVRVCVCVLLSRVWPGKHPPVTDLGGLRNKGAAMHALRVGALEANSVSEH